MTLSQSSLSIIENTIRKAVEKYNFPCEQAIITDIHLQPNQNSGELSIFNDDDEELANVIVKEWEAYEDADFLEGTGRVLTALLNDMNSSGNFDKMNILKPFSFVLVDDDKETVTELLLIDDDTLLANDPLLKGLDEELDAFLKKLLEE